MIRLADILGRSIALSEKGGTGNSGAASWSSTGRLERANSAREFGAIQKSHNQSYANQSFIHY